MRTWPRNSGLRSIFASCWPFLTWMTAFRTIWSRVWVRRLSWPVSVCLDEKVASRALSAVWFCELSRPLSLAPASTLVIFPPSSSFMAVSILMWFSFANWASCIIFETGEDSLFGKLCWAESPPDCFPESFVDEIRLKRLDAPVLVGVSEPSLSPEASVRTISKGLCSLPFSLASSPTSRALPTDFIESVLSWISACEAACEFSASWIDPVCLISLGDVVTTRFILAKGSDGFSPGSPPPMWMPELPFWSSWPETIFFINWFKSVDSVDRLSASSPKGFSSLWDETLPVWTFAINCCKRSNTAFISTDDPKSFCPSRAMRIFKAAKPSALPNISSTLFAKLDPPAESWIPNFSRMLITAAKFESDAIWLSTLSRSSTSCFGVSDIPASRSVAEDVVDFPPPAPCVCLLGLLSFVICSRESRKLSRLSPDDSL